MLRNDYSGAFDPELSLSGFSRQALAKLGREYLLAGHLQDRVGLPLVIQHGGGNAYAQLAIDEWMSASPLYSKRMQRAMNFEGADVGTVFKNLQLDIGAPHQFMDFQFRLDGPTYGEFWLAHCGALLDVEPFGEARVKMMCHDIEDPTFDATAASTHPCMKMRPIHRPPRNPAGRHPACRWSVFIDDDTVPFEHHPNLERVGRSKLAQIETIAAVGEAEPGGWSDYSGPFDPGFQLEDLSHRALVESLQEVAIQSHLLARAFMLCADQRLGSTLASEIGAAQWTGIAALTAERLRPVLGIRDDEAGQIGSIAKIFQLHPCFHPRSYLDLHIELTGDASARLSIGPCPAFEEGDDHSWFAGLSKEAHPALDAIAGAVNPQARCHPVDDPTDARFAWDIVIDRDAPPQAPPPELALARISRGAGFQFERRRNLRS
jgi:hypothetical protein